MTERDAIFRQRLIEVMKALNGGEARDPALRKLIGGYAQKLAREAGVRSWAELKARADAPTYDSMLKIFHLHSAEFAKAGDSKGVRGLEVLGLSLVARHQAQADLVPGIKFLDAYVDECFAVVKLKSNPTIKVRTVAH